MAWTYEAQVLDRGEGELEHYMTLSSEDRAHPKGRTATEHQVELEVGMNGRFDFGIYQVFSQPPGEGLTYDGYKLRAREMLGSLGKTAGSWPAVAYLEYAGAPDFSRHEFEGKFILHGDLGRFRLALNPTLAVEQGESEEEGEGAESESDWEANAEYSAGLVYRVGERFSAGLEAKGARTGHYLGPVIAHGGDGLWVALGSALALGNPDPGEPELQIRMLLGVGLR